MKRYAILFALLACANFCRAQIPSLDWVTTPTSAAQSFSYANTYDQNGNSFMLCAYNTINGSLDLDPSSNVVSVTGLGMAVAKYDPLGNMLWAAPIAATPTSAQGCFVAPRAVTCDNQGNVYITGYVGQATVDFDPSSTSDSVYTSHGINSDLFFAKYSASGTLAWGYLIGEYGTEEGNSLVCDSQFVYLAGRISCFTDFDPSDSNFVVILPTICAGGFIAKYTQAGNFVWAGTMNGIPNGDPGYAIPNSIQIDNTNKLVVAGLLGGNPDFNFAAPVDTVRAYNSEQDAFFAKYDTSGNYLYMKQLITPIGVTVPYAMEIDHTGNLILTGFYVGNVDVDPGPATTLLTATSTTVSNGFLAKYDSNGNYLWAGSLGNTAGTEALDLAVDDYNNILICGRYKDSLDLDFGNGTYFVTAVPNQSQIDALFAAKYMPSGNLLWGFSLATPYSNVAAYAVDYTQNKMILSGTFGGLTDFDPSASSVTANSSFQDFFHAQFNDNTVNGISVPDHASSFSLFPNPSTDQLYISNWSDFNSYHIYSISGQLLATGASSSSVDVQSLAYGVYVFELIAENGDVHREKFIRQ